MNQDVSALLYLLASIFFILALKGLSHPETSPVSYTHLTLPTIYSV